MIGPATTAAAPWATLTPWLCLGQLRGLSCAWCGRRFVPGKETRQVAADLWACVDRALCQIRWEARTDHLAGRMRQHLGELGAMT